MKPRSSGILLHITSLPGKEGIGTLGKNAREWIDFLHNTGQQLWQVLPVGPVSAANCPYQSYSAFAGNPLLIDLSLLKEEGLLSDDDLNNIPKFEIRQVQFEKVATWKNSLLRKAFSNFRKHHDNSLENDYAGFREEHNWWLNDFTLFMTACDFFGKRKWQEWPEEMKRRDPSAIHDFREKWADEIFFHSFLQFCFFRQWKQLKVYAQNKGIRIIGDIPLYVSGNSVDVWANTDLFLLDEEMNPLKVAGVPPDYFSSTGQLWGTPVFNWENLRKQGYHWWLARIHFNLRLYDEVRIDHFRGLEAFWSVPAGEETAVTGEWVPADGFRMLEILQKQLGTFPLIAEDLGTITPEVASLRDRFDMPGMKVLQFAFNSDPSNIHLPHNFTTNTVVYTGTHDNDTTWAWLHSANDDEKKMALKYLKNYHYNPVWGLIEMAWSSVSVKAVVPLQDLLELGAEARMNIPGVPLGNWGWRFRWDQIRGKHRRFLREITEKYNRTPNPSLTGTG